MKFNFQAAGKHIQRKLERNQ